MDELLWPDKPFQKQQELSSSFEPYLKVISVSACFLSFISALSQIQFS